MKPPTRTARQAAPSAPQLIIPFTARAPLEPAERAEVVALLAAILLQVATPRQLEEHADDAS